MATQQNPPSIKEAIAVGATVIGLTVWSHVALVFVVPALWGDYALAFADAGPLFLSRGLFFFAFLVAPVAALLYPVLHARSRRHWISEQLCALVLVAGLWLAYGAYVHNVAYYRGVDTSLATIALEVGFKNADAVPLHIRQALELSERLAAEDNEPWLPGAWRRVDWPAIPKNVPVEAHHEN